MQIDKKTVRNVFLLVVGGIFFYWLLHETERFRTLWSTVMGTVSPFILGAGLAFIINVPMRAFERHLAFIKSDALRRLVAVILTFVAIFLLLYSIVQLLLPQISETIMTLIPKLTDFFLRLERFITQFLADNPEVLAWINANTEFKNFNWSGLLQQAATILKNSLTVIASGAFSAVGSVAGALVDAVFGVMFSLYCLFRKEILARQGRKLLYAFIPERAADEIIRVMRLINSTFSNFISGQCLEACILGCLFAATMACFRLPYIPLISVLIAVTALVPIVGAFVGCILGAFFILVNDVLQAVLFVALFLVLQQIEGNLIYPRVVGTSVGLPGMWVLVAVTVGGDMMGVFGMFVMIPLASVCYTLLREFTTRRVRERDIDPDKLRAHPPELKSQFKENREKREQQKFRKQMDALAAKYKAQQKNKENHK